MIGLIGRFLPNARPKVELPPAVLADVARQQDESERLVSWIQLVIALAFALLYGLSRKTAPTHTLFTPMAIGAYLVLTLGRVYFSHRRRLTFPWLAGSIVLDMTLLFGLIWSFHIQYQQPASFYLKSPTLLYVFIFIALRALRFEARYVLIAGAVAMLGWLMLVLYVIAADSANTMITRNYVEYLTSNSVLIGAEVDKMISILMVTGIIALAIARARSVMTRAISEGRAKQNLSRFFDADIARHISHRGDELMAGYGEAREISILNLDARGFTRLASGLPPTETMRVLADYQGAMLPIIQRHGGSIDKFLGDGIMATFGAGEPQSDHAARACRALEEAIDAADSWARAQQAAGRPGLMVCGAVASGRVVIGAVGMESRLEFTVIGDAVNLSAKLEKHNKTLGTRAIVLGSTYDEALAKGFRPIRQSRSVRNEKISGTAQLFDLTILA